MIKKFLFLVWFFVFFFSVFLIIYLLSSMTILFILLGVFSFMILVITHELGHFFAAKKSGVKVNEFWIWLPPRICKVRTDKSGTEYTINAIPLGGFCVLEGDDPNRPEATYAKNSFVTAKLWKKLIIMVWGVTVNALTAFLIFTGLFWHGTSSIGVSWIENSESYFMPWKDFAISQNLITVSEQPWVLVTQLSRENEILEVWDILLEFNGQTVTLDTITTLLDSGKWKENLLKILRINQEQTAREEKEIWFSCSEDTCRLWALITEYLEYEYQPIKFWFVDAVKASFHEIGAERSLTFDFLGKIWNSLLSFDKDQMKEAVSSLSGPVGIIKVGEVIFERNGCGWYLAFLWIIALSLAMFNLLPIPALDGGSGLCLIIQAIFKISHEKYLKYITYINAFFFWSLMTLWIIIIFKDLAVFWNLPIPFFW